MYVYADYATTMRRMRERLPKEYTVLSFLSSISFLFGLALAGKPQLPSSSDISGSIIYVTPLPSSKIQNSPFTKTLGAFPDSNILSGYVVNLTSMTRLVVVRRKAGNLNRKALRSTDKREYIYSTGSYIAFRHCKNA